MRYLISGRNCLVREQRWRAGQFRESAFHLELRLLHFGRMRDHGRD